MKTWFHAFISLLFPRYCVVCNSVLCKGEEYICMRCNMDMPRTNYHQITDNQMEQLLWGRVEVERATAWFFYTKGSPYNSLIHQLKYKGQKEIGCMAGRYLASEIKCSTFFNDIDFIVPVPLHPKRLRTRGYNQSEQIARGISDITGIPVRTSLIVRKKNTQTQTRRSRYTRIENMEEVFQLTSSDENEGKHILLVDDIVTTGATIVSCANALQQEGNIRISIISLGFVAQ